MNKIGKIGFVLLMISLVAISTFAAPSGATSLSRANTLATVTVGNRTKSITQADFNKKKEQYAKSGATYSDSELLDVLINDTVFLLNAEKDGVNVTDADVDAQLKQVRQSYESATGKPLSDDEFESRVVAQFGMSMSDVKESLKEQAILSEYLRMKRPNEINKTFNVTDDEINTFYRQNSTSFVSPQAVKISHIFKAEATTASQNQANLRSLQSILSDIRSNKIAFEAAVERYSDTDLANSKARGGDIGWVTYQAADTIGKDFVEAAMGLQTGEVYNGVLHTSLGYHIIKATASSPQKFLALTDYVSPDNQVTVKQYIEQGLMQRKSQENFVSVTNALVDELRKSAKINITQK